MSKRPGKALLYTVFSTDWGYFGLAGTPGTLVRTHLPLVICSRVVQRLTAHLGPAEFDAGYMQALQNRIKAYYKGTYAGDFADVRVDLRRFTPFAAAVLRSCRKIRPGKTSTYAQLADRAGSPKAIRAVGGALASNPLPLIIPCHRVIRSDGKLGGFSSPGGAKLKKRMLMLERCLD